MGQMVGCDGAVDALRTPRAYPSECPRTREPRKCSKRSSMRHKAHENLLQLLGDTLKKLRGTHLAIWDVRWDRVIRRQRICCVSGFRLQLDHRDQGFQSEGRTTTIARFSWSRTMPTLLTHTRA